MTVPTATSRADFSGTGTTGPFPFTFRILDATHLRVTKKSTAGVETTLSLTTDYAVSGAGSFTGGSVTLVVALAVGESLSLRRVVPLTQLTDLRNQNTFYAETLEDSLDYLMEVCQQLADDANRSLRLPETDASALLLPTKTLRASKALSFDVNGDPTASAAPASGTISAPMQPVTSAATLATARTAMGVGAVAVCVKDAPYSATGNGSTDDTAAIQSAINAAIAAGGGRVFFPVGSYKCGNLTLGSNVYLQGEPGATLSFKSGSSWLMSANPGSGGSSDPTTNLNHITISGLTFRGLSDTAGFSEQVHLLNLNAVSDILIENCDFIAPQGDGIYLGSSNVGATERHNERVTIRSCRFDGKGKLNRNGISIIDGTDVLVHGCYFTDLSNTTMPGAIDIEPDVNAFARIRNIIIDACWFNDIGGNVGAVALHLTLPQSGLTIPAQNIQVTHCCLLNCARGIVMNAASVAAGDVPHGVIIAHCVTIGSHRGFQLANLKGCSVNHNLFSRSQYSALISYVASPVFDVDVSDNNFFECGTIEGLAATVFGATRLDMRRNTFENCGLTNNTFGISIDFNTGTSDHVNLVDNRIVPGARMTGTTIQKEAAHTFTPAGNFDSGNDWGGKVSQFAAGDGDELQSYTPVAAGSTTAGAGTYVTQLGRYVRRGNMVWFWVEIAWSAHTGTGIIQISLPLAVADASGSLPPCPLSVEGAGLTYAAGDVPVGWVYAGASVNGVLGAVRALRQGAAGTVGTFLVAAATAQRLHVSGCYPCATR